MVAVAGGLLPSTAGGEQGERELHHRLQLQLLLPQCLPLELAVHPIPEVSALAHQLWSHSIRLPAGQRGGGGSH